MKWLGLIALFFVPTILCVKQKEPVSQLNKFVNAELVLTQNFTGQ